VALLKKIEIEIKNKTSLRASEHNRQQDPNLLYTGESETFTCWENNVFILSAVVCLNE
jgi:hypothetical protein